jgi:hypothetical protein
MCVNSITTIMNIDKLHIKNLYKTKTDYYNTMIKMIIKYNNYYDDNKLFLVDVFN